MNTPGPLTRRSFLAKAGALTTASVAAPHLHLAVSAASGSGRKVAANSRLQLGLIGCGGMGRANLANCARYDDVVVTAACDVWRERREAVADQHRATCKPYLDYREVLGRDDVDAVIIASPPHWHALQAIDACRAGKDIYLQKPMTLHLAESLAVRNAVRRHGRVSQIGTQIHAGENYRRVVEQVRSGCLGRIGVVRTFHVMNETEKGVGHSDVTTPPDGFDWDFWCGPAVRRSFSPILVENAHNHCSWMDYSGGWTPGMAPHIVDLPIWALELGYPTMVGASGGRFVVQDDGDAYDHHEVLWRYPNLTLTWMSSITNSYGFDFQGDKGRRRRLGIYLHGSQGTLYANYGTNTVIPESEQARDPVPPVEPIPPSPGQEREWLDCIKTRKQPKCNAAYHVRVDVPIVLSLLALKLGRSIRFDPEAERIVGDPEAERLAVPSYRSPWRFPTEYL